MTTPSRTTIEQAQDLIRQFPVNPNPKQPRDGRKPCGCGKSDCFVIQGPDEKPFSFRRRRYASRACWPTAAEHCGALVASLDWLVNAPPGRIIAQRQAQGLTR